MLPLRLRVAEGNVDDVPPKWSTLLLKGVEVQENIYAANAGMTDIICVPISLPEVRARVHASRPLPHVRRPLLRRGPCLTATLFYFSGAV